MSASLPSWKNALLRPLAAVPSLTRQDYLASYRFRNPVLIRGGASACAAVGKWDLAYLRQAVGDALVDVGRLPEGEPHDFTRRQLEKIRLGSLLDDIGRGRAEERTYLFNTDSCLFLDNPRRPDRRLWWGASGPNPGLAPLARDFKVPDFIGDDFIFGTLILGPPGSGTRLHYDWGGEAKAMVQIRGRKRVLLFSSAMAPFLGLTSIFDGQSLGNDALTDRTDAADEMPSGVSGFVADMEPGDVLYFPAFWFHKVENAGALNIAVGVGIDELPSSPLAVRFDWYLAVQALLSEASHRLGGERGPVTLQKSDRLEIFYEGRRVGNLKELLAACEKLLLSEPLRTSESFWSVAQNLLAAANTLATETQERPEVRRK